MRSIFAVLLSILLIGTAAAQDGKQAGEPVYDERGRLVGYVDTKADDLTELECLPEDSRPYPACFTFSDDSGDNDGEDS